MDGVIGVKALVVARRVEAARVVAIFIVASLLLKMAYLVITINSISFIFQLAEVPKEIDISSLSTKVFCRSIEVRTLSFPPPKN